MEGDGNVMRFLLSGKENEYGQDNKRESLNFKVGNIIYYLILKLLDF